MAKYKDFDKKMNEKILPKFASAKEWTELLKVVTYFKENLKKYQSFNMTKISDKITLERRLAYALHPLMPGGLHEVTLEVYDELFENIRRHEENNLGYELGLYASGLLPFFQYASAPNKVLFLEKIVMRHFLEISEQELKFLLPGLLASVLPGLEEQKDEMQKLLKDIFFKTRKASSEEEFYGCLWMVILRTPKIRLVGMKYLIDSIPAYKTVDQDSKEDLALIRKNFFPGKSVLVVNSLSAMIEDNNIQVQRIAMDFMITRLPMHNRIFSDKDKIPIIMSSLTLLSKSEYSTTRRLFNWILNSEYDDEVDMQDDSVQYAIKLLVSAFDLLFKTHGGKTGLKILDQLFKQRVNFVDYVLPYVSYNLLDALYDDLDDEVMMKLKKFFEFDPIYLDCLWTAIHNELKNDQKRILYKRIKIVEFCLRETRLDSLEKKYKYFIPIVTTLLGLVDYFDVASLKEVSSLKHVLNICLKLILDIQETQERLTSDIIKGKQILRFNSSEVSPSEEFKARIKSLENFFIKVCKALLVNSYVDISEFDLFKTTVQLVVKIQVYKEEENRPEWLIYLVKIIFICENIVVSLEALQFILDILIFQQENDTIRSIKLFLRQETLSSEILDGRLVQLETNQTTADLAMSKLWHLLKDLSIQKKVIDSLLKFFRSDPDLFSHSISSTFTSNDLEDTVKAISIFSQFWKLTSEFYPDIIFFPKGECIFMLLDFLDHEHPLVRHVSKSWLSQTSGHLYKVIDPLLIVLLDKETKFFVTPKNSIVFTEPYDNKRIIEAFRKLKNIIINTSDSDRVIKYLSSTSPSGYIADLADFPCDFYLDLLVNISMRFIRGKFIEALSSQFFKENFAVNAASCEFLEFLLSFVENKTKVMNIAGVISEPILSILLENVKSDDVVMQVQLLNLLKVLLFSTEPVHSQNLELTERMFMSRTLHDCINLGIQIDYIFVRSHFISFLEQCFRIFEKILSIEENLKIANKLLITSASFLIRRVEYFNTLNSKKILRSSKKYNKISALNEDPEYFIVKNYLNEYKEMKNYDENDISVIIKGIMEILFNFLNIKSPKKLVTQVCWAQVSEKIVNNNKAKSWGSSILGLFTSTKPSKADGSLDRDVDIFGSVFQIFEEVLKSLLHCWLNESEDFMGKDLCLSNNGMLLLDENTKITNILSNESDVTKQFSYIRGQIIEINLNLFVLSPMEFIEVFMHLWFCDELFLKDKQNKLSMIEILTGLNIPTSILLNCIYSNLDTNKIKNYKRSKIKVNKIYPYYISHPDSLYEAKFCHLLFAVFTYTKFIDHKWEETLDLLECLSESKAISTLLWIVEIFNLLLIKTPLNKHVKSRIEDFFDLLFQRITDISIFNKISIVYENPGCLVKPLPPSIYELVAREAYGDKIFKMNYSSASTQVNETRNSENIQTVDLERLPSEQNQPKVSELQLNKKDTSDHPDINLDNPEHAELETEVKLEEEKTMQSSEDTVVNFYNKIFKYVLTSEILQSDEQIACYRVIAYLTLKSRYYTLLRNAYSQEKMQRLISHLYNTVKSLFEILSSSEPVDDIINEITTEFLESIFTQSNFQLANSCKSLIMNYFLEPDFFKMNRKCLRLWMSIIKNFSQYFPNLVEELFEQMNTHSYFSKNSDNDKTKIKSLRRVSFIIYSSEKDTFKIEFILEKVKEFITKNSENPPLEAEVFLLIRIMFLKFTRNQLIELLRNLWPIIFAEISTILANKKKVSSLDLPLACLKLIECLSLANMEEFCLYQWIFILDTYEISKINPNSESNLIQRILTTKEKHFKPFVMELLKDFNPKDCEDLSFQVPQSYNDQDMRGLILKNRNVSNKSELGSLITKLIGYISQMNNFKPKINWGEIEKTIESDFLNTDFS